MEQILYVNTFQPTFVIKVLLKQMLDREKRSAVVVTSSGLGLIPVAGTAVYAASKAYASSFTQALGYELSDRIDFADWPCGEVKTRLYGDYGEKNPRAITATKAVTPLLKQIGHDRITYGNSKHEISSHSLGLMSEKTINGFMFKGMSRVFNENMAKKSEQERDAYLRQGVL